MMLGPTPALRRAAVAGGVALLLAVLLGREQLVLVGLPLVLWAVLALALRFARGQDTALAAPRLRVSSQDLEEGATAALTVPGPRGMLTAATIPPPPQADVAPRRGALAGEGNLPLRLTARRWGRIRVGPTHVLIADPFGAFRAQQQLQELEVRVVPTSVVLDAPAVVPTPLGISGVHLSRRRGDGTALAEVRPFRSGDRLHRINWPVTSRTGTLHTNATFTEQDTDVLIVTDTTLDITPAPWAAGDAPTSLDMTIRATTAIARHYLTLGDRVALTDLGHLIGPVPVGSGPRQLRVLTSALAQAGRADGLLRRVNRIRSVRPGTLVVVCSPLLGEEVIAQIGRLVAFGGDVIVVDTLPPSIGEVGVLRGRPVQAEGVDPLRCWPEAWALRRLLRQGTIAELRQAGVPVTAWEGPSSLAPILTSLSAARTAPRRRRS